MSTFVKPFRIGDVVHYAGHSHHWKGQHIITEVSVMDVGVYNYATLKGAWIDHEELRLVRECDEKSMTKLVNEMGFD